MAVFIPVARLSLHAGRRLQQRRQNPPLGHHASAWLAVPDVSHAYGSSIDLSLMVNLHQIVILKQTNTTSLAG